MDNDTVAERSYPFKEREMCNYLGIQSDKHSCSQINRHLNIHESCRFVMIQKVYVLYLLIKHEYSVKKATALTLNTTLVYGTCIQVRQQ